MAPPAVEQTPRTKTVSQAQIRGLETRAAGHFGGELLRRQNAASQHLGEQLGLGIHGGSAVFSRSALPKKACQSAFFSTCTCLIRTLTLQPFRGFRQYTNHGMVLHLTLGPYVECPGSSVGESTIDLHHAARNCHKGTDTLSKCPAATDQPSH